MFQNSDRVRKKRSDRRARVPVSSAGNPWKRSRSRSHRCAFAAVIVARGVRPPASPHRHSNQPPATSRRTRSSCFFFLLFSHTTTFQLLPSCGSALSSDPFVSTLSHPFTLSLSRTFTPFFNRVVFSSSIYAFLQPNVRDHRRF